MALQQILENNPQIGQQWRQAVDEFQSNQRLRIGFWLVLGILLFYIGLQLSDSRTIVEKQIIQAKHREVKAVHLAEESIWLNRAKESQRSLYDLQLKFNHASTQGVAKATLQGLMNELIEQSSLEQARIRVEDAESTASVLPLWAFAVSIDATFDANKMEGFLYLLSRHQYHFTVETMDVMPSVKRLRMRLKYWFANSAELDLVRSKNQSLETELAKNQSTEASNSDRKTLNKSEQEAVKQGVPDELFQ